MSRSFVFTTWEGGGNIPPMLVVVRKLLAVGHEVRVMSDACNRAEAEVSGARFAPWTTAPSRRDKSVASDLIKDWGAPGPDGLRLTIQTIMAGPAGAYAADLMAELDRSPADLVVTSEMLLGVIAACEHRQQRVAILTANISLVPLPGMPPMGPGLTPARTDAERAEHAAISTFNEQLFDDAGLRALNAARAALGLGALAHLCAQYDRADAYLLGTSAAFDFSATSMPAYMRYVGPQLGTPAWARPWVSPWSAGDKRPLVLVAFSTTFQNHVAILQRVVDALERLSVRVVVTLGPTVASQDIVHGPHVQVIESAPHDQILRQAALVVTHGGHGTVMAALVHGVPLLVLPLGRDQNDNAARVAAHAVGLRLDPAATVEELATAGEALVRDARFRDNARALGSRVARDARESPVVTELELLASHSARIVRVTSSRNM